MVINCNIIDLGTQLEDEDEEEDTYTRLYNLDQTKEETPKKRQKNMELTPSVFFESNKKGEENNIEDQLSNANTNKRHRRNMHSWDFGDSQQTPNILSDYLPQNNLQNKEIEGDKDNNSSSSEGELQIQNIHKLSYDLNIKEIQHLSTQTDNIFTIDIGVDPIFSEGGYSEGMEITNIYIRDSLQYSATPPRVTTNDQNSKKGKGLHHRVKTALEFTKKGGKGIIVDAPHEFRETSQTFIEGQNKNMPSARYQNEYEEEKEFITRRSTCSELNLENLIMQSIYIYIYILYRIISDGFWM